MNEEFSERLQTAVGFIAARRRGDFEGAETLLREFNNDAQRTLAFSFLAELAFQMLADKSERPVADLLTEVSTQIAAKSN